MPKPKLATPALPTNDLGIGDDFLEETRALFGDEMADELAKRMKTQQEDEQV